MGGFLHAERILREAAMYNISNAFLSAVKANTRKYYWTGRIVTKGGAVYDFDQEDMVKCSCTVKKQATENKR